MEELRYEIFSRLGKIPDPRVERTKVHSLPALLFIALCAFLTAGKSFYEIELFADAHKAWLKKVVRMVSVPSHDTFNRIFQPIKPEHFTEFLARATDSIRENINGEIGAFDGKRIAALVVTWIPLCICSMPGRSKIALPLASVASFRQEQ